MKIKPHKWTGETVAGEVLIEWGDDDALILQVEVEQVKDRPGEGIELQIDHGMASLRMPGGTGGYVMASVAMTEEEARALHAELGKALDG